MKTFLLNRRNLWAFSLLLTLFAGCDWEQIKGIPDRLSDELRFAVALPAPATSFSIQFVDAKTGQTITNAKIDVTLEGDQKSDLMDPIFYEPITEVSTDVGVVQLAVRDAIVPSNTKPVRFNVMASANGYLRTGKSIVANQKGQYNETLEMVKLEAPPEGTAVAADKPAGSTDNSGKTTSTVTISTPPESDTQVVASVTIPQGSVIKDGNGQPLQGALQATVVYHSNQSDDALGAFPGGLNNIPVQLQNGSDQDGNFVSGGFVSIQIKDQSGRSASTFSDPLVIKLSIPKDTINPLTNQPIKAGDTVPLWSYNEETGEWKEEGTGVYQKTGGSAYLPGKGFVLGKADQNGNFPITFHASHLSYWNMDWFNGGCSWDAPLTLNIQNKPAGLSIRYEITRTQGGGYVKTVWGDPDNTIYLYRQPNFPLTITAYADDTIVGSLGVTNPCGATLNFPLNVQDQFLTVDFVGKAVCSAEKREIWYSGYIYIWDTNVPNSTQYIYAENGHANTSIRWNHTYSASTYYYDKSASQYKQVTVRFKAEKVGTAAKITVTDGVTSEVYTSEVVDGKASFTASFTDIKEICDAL